MPLSAEYPSRRQTLLPGFAEHKIDGLLVTSLANIRYLTGFTGSHGALYLAPGKAILFTDPRYTLQASQETNCDVRILAGSLFPGLVKALHRLKPGQLGFEKSQMPYFAWDYLTRESKSRYTLVAVDGLVEKQRMVKSEGEIALIRESVNLNSQAFDRALKRFKPGMRESDLAAEIDYQMRRLGASATAFETIVATGAHSALPHARPGETRIETNQLLLIDMGATRQGYTSDMTRTVFTGKAAPVWRKRYQAVLEAQQASIATIRDGARSVKVDAAGRQVLKGHGLDKQFTHSTGHGLGLEIHEAPRLGKRDKSVLRAGMVVTVEPGIYLEGQGGIRIEDTVLVTASGCEILTPTSKELTVI